MRMISSRHDTVMVIAPVRIQTFIIWQQCFGLLEILNKTWGEEMRPDTAFVPDVKREFLPA